LELLLKQSKQELQATQTVVEQMKEEQRATARAREKEKEEMKKEFRREKIKIVSDFAMEIKVKDGIIQ